MPLTRRALLAAGVAAVASGSAACAAPPRLPAPPPGPPADAEPGTADELLAWLGSHPERVSLLVDDGRGAALERRADTARPVASAGKVVHLTAYAQAVVAGRLDPAATLPVADWERWYLPYTDGGAHPAALRRLGATASGAVTWDDVVGAMVRESDNAAPDLLRATLGDAALAAAAAAAGWTPWDAASLLGETLLAVLPEQAAEPRREVAARLAREYAGGGALREEAQDRTAASLADEPAAFRWAAGTPAGSVRQLAGLHRAAATGALDGPEVAGVVRGHLEAPLADRLAPGVLGIGTKGGSLPGVLSDALTLRRADGTTAVAAVSLDGLSPDEYARWGGGAVGTLTARLVTEPLLLAHAERTVP